MTNNIEENSNNPTVEQLQKLEIDHLRIYAREIKSRYRLIGKLVEAVREYEKVLEAYQGSLQANTGITYADLSEIQYELGTIAFLRAQTEQAVKFFEESARNANLNNDPVRAEIGIFRAIHAKLLAETIPYQQAYEEILNSLDRLSILSSQGHNSSLCDGWIFNIQDHLFDLAVDMKNIDEAKLRFKQFEEAKSTIENLKQDPPSRQTLIVKYSKQGRIFFIENKFDQALENFAAYLETDLSEWGVRNTQYIATSNDIQDMARDYLYAGICLKEKGLKDKAMQVFNAGLLLDPNNGNSYFQKRIRAEM